MFRDVYDNRYFWAKKFTYGYGGNYGRVKSLFDSVTMITPMMLYIVIAREASERPTIQRDRVQKRYDNEHDLRSNKALRPYYEMQLKYGADKWYK